MTICNTIVKILYKYIHILFLRKDEILILVHELKLKRKKYLIINIEQAFQLFPTNLSNHLNRCSEILARFIKHIDYIFPYEISFRGREGVVRGEIKDGNPIPITRSLVRPFPGKFHRKNRATD